MRALLMCMLTLMACRRDDDAAPIVVSPDGGRGAVATCFFRNDCIVAIAKTCPRGYTITHENAYVEMVADCH